MTRATSSFLDALRLGAALVVFLSHTTNYWNPSLAWVMQLWAHHAVIVFFVLSGYVIAHTTREGARDARHYVVARLSRLYSVVAPALILTAALWFIGREFDPDVYKFYDRTHPWLRFLASGLFVNEVWMLELSPPTNTPFWSLGYEAWYYLFFGLVLFVKAPRWRWISIVLCGLLAGPNVLMLLPVWLVGVAAYVWRDMGSLPRIGAWAGLLGVALLTVWALYALPDWPAKRGVHPWYFAGSAVSDLVCGSGWAALIWFFNRSLGTVPVPELAYRSVRWLAGHTFSLYLYHAPLVILMTALVPPFMVKGFEWLALAMVLVLVFVLGAITEGQRPKWKRLFEVIWDGVGRRVRPVA